MFHKQLTLIRVVGPAIKRASYVRIYLYFRDTIGPLRGRWQQRKHEVLASRQIAHKGERAIDDVRWCRRRTFRYGWALGARLFFRRPFPDAELTSIKTHRKTCRASYSRSGGMKFVRHSNNALAAILTASIEFNGCISRSSVIRQLITAYQSVKSCTGMPKLIKWLFIKMPHVFPYSNSFEGISGIYPQHRTLKEYC